MKTLEAVKAMLAACVREELTPQLFNESAIGDSEVTWIDKDGNKIAYGYYGSKANVSGVVEEWNFDGKDAQTLRYCGTRGNVECNDPTPIDHGHEAIYGDSEPMRE